MPVIQHHDLQYPTETRYYQKLRPLLDRLRNKHARFAEMAKAKDREFYNLLAHSLKVSNSAGIRALVGDVNRALGANYSIHIFVSASPTANAMCMSRFGYSSGNSNEPVIIVSQHFLNELNRDEQVCIIGHELGHILFGHAFIPAKVILEFPFKMADIGSLKSDVLKWMICSEISCDLVGFVAGGRKTQPFIDGMLKFTTGLQQTGVESLGAETLYGLARQQFDELVRTGQSGALSTHPLTLLRIKIVEEMAHSPLLKEFGNEMQAPTLRQHKDHFAGAIDAIVRKVYPEVPVNGQTTDSSILFEAGMAVILADGKLISREVETLRELSSEKRDIGDLLRKIQTNIKARGQERVIRDLVAGAVSRAKAAGITAQTVRSLTRQLLIIAASDGRIEQSELNAIHLFSAEFGLDFPGLLKMIASLGLR